ncbi:MAG: hypothetical protein DMG52_19180 [Acidobacteria bacterium]|nr:MAG: hypothetical protein DMG52_19180 [Acidobacteriota bacterium]
MTLQRTEYQFDLCQLHVARPKDAGNVGTKQAVPVVPFRLKTNLSPESSRPWLPQLPFMRAVGSTGKAVAEDQRVRSNSRIRGMFPL